MTQNARAMLLAGVFAGVGGVGIALFFASSTLVPTRFLGGEVEFIVGSILAALMLFDLPALLLLSFVSSNVVFKFIAAPFLSFVLYALVFRGLLSVHSWIGFKRKV